MSKDTQIRDFLERVKFHHNHPTKAGLRSSFVPVIDEFLNSYDKDVLSMTLNDLKTNENNFDMIGQIIIKYHQNLILNEVDKKLWPLSHYLQSKMMKTPNDDEPKKLKI